MDNSVFVIKQPQCSICTVIFVDSRKLPLDEKSHKAIDELRKFSDVFFVFSEVLGLKGIDLEKFSTLYSACAWTKGDLVGSTMIGALEYSVEVFKRHKVFLLTDTTRLETAVIDQEKIYNISLSGSVAPIFKLDRLTSEELGKIYMTDEEEREWTFGFLHSKSPKIKDRLNSLYKSTSNILFIRDLTVESLLVKITDKKFREYVETFTEDDFSYLIASLIVYLGIDNINCSLEKLNYGGEDLQTGRKKR